ncbi:hypothetical protein AIOL_001252 [Candidatus Rhodobacter oscarellae]|uniref:Uncharacterized protein n=1 Tax=Candidatus Rhodobacter oscarellae TaxID=1675527 RepID=A0A0J9E0P8_9RHOB|nr:hypothetical protein AIOL_001252 [Candidatus Rhodobacter lobularis]
MALSFITDGLDRLTPAATSGEGSLPTGIVRVNGVERYFWVECIGSIGRARKLRGQPATVITTDDARQYVFFANARFRPRVLAGLPAGPSPHWQPVSLLLDPMQDKIPA